MGSMDKDYGKCAVCNKPFTSGDDVLRLSCVRYFQSQGYPSEFVSNTKDVHPECASFDFLLTFTKN